MKQALQICMQKLKCVLKKYLFDDEGERNETFKLVDTTVGRALLSEILPEGLPFDFN